MASFMLRPLYYWEEVPVHIEQEAEWIPHFAVETNSWLGDGGGDCLDNIQGEEAEEPKITCFFTKPSTSFK